MTLDEWLDIWLRDYLTGVKPSTAYLYQRQAKLYIRPALGSVRLDRLEPHTIQRFYNSLYEERDGKPPLSAKSIKNIHGILHKALQQAVLLNYLRTNPANACILPKVIKKEIHPMDDRDTARFLEAIKGCRYERQQKLVQTQMRLAAGPAWQESGLVFTNEFGRYISLRAVFDCFKRTVRKVGLPNLRIHDLRHTYAVNSIRAGDDIKTVQSNLGHATAAFTLDVYGHFTDDMRQASSQRMEQFISGVLGL